MVAAQPPKPRNYSVQYSEDSLSADPDLMLKQVDQFPVELMEQLILQGIGGAELISVVRHDQVDGQKVLYQPIANLEQLKQEYNPQTITQPAASFASFRSVHGITDDSSDGSPTSPDIVRLSNTSDGVLVEVEVPFLPTGIAIEVATSYSFAEPLTTRPSDMVYYVGAAAPNTTNDRALDGGGAQARQLNQVSGGGARIVEVALDGANAMPGYRWDVPSLQWVLDPTGVQFYSGYVDGGTSRIFGSDFSVDGGAALSPTEVVSATVYGQRGSFYGPF